MDAVWIMSRRRSESVNTRELVLGAFTSPEAACADALRGNHLPLSNWRSPRAGRDDWELVCEPFTYNIVAYPVKHLAPLPFTDDLYQGAEPQGYINLA